MDLCPLGDNVIMKVMVQETITIFKLLALAK